jgi:hypothetical protein
MVRRVPSSVDQWFVILTRPPPGSSVFGRYLMNPCAISHSKEDQPRWSPFASHLRRRSSRRPKVKVPNHAPPGLWEWTCWCGVPSSILSSHESVPLASFSGCIVSGSRARVPSSNLASKIARMTRSGLGSRVRLPSAWRTGMTSSGTEYVPRWSPCRALRPAMCIKTCP